MPTRSPSPSTTVSRASAGSRRPSLLEHDLPATLFVVSDAVGSTNVWRGERDVGIPVFSLLDWEALGRLVADGFSIGAHTCTHLDLASADPDAAAREIVASKARLAHELGLDVTTFAYPYGGVSAAARDVVAREFRYGVTTRLAVLAPYDDPAQLPRLDSYYLRATGSSSVGDRALPHAHGFARRSALGTSISSAGASHDDARPSLPLCHRSRQERASWCCLACSTC